MGSDDESKDICTARGQPAAKISRAPREGSGPAEQSGNEIMIYTDALRCRLSGALSGICLAHDLSQLPQVRIIVAKTKDEASHSVNRPDAWIGRIGRIKMWLVGPGIKHGVAHAAALFKALVQLCNGMYSAPWHFIARAALDRESTSQRKR